MDSSSLKDRFSYHAPDKAKLSRHAAVRSACLEAATILEEVIPPGAERALAVRKLEEAMFWANAGIARWVGELSKVEMAEVPEMVSLRDMVFSLCLEIEKLPPSDQQTTCIVSASNVYRDLSKLCVKPMARNEREHPFQVLKRIDPSLVETVQASRAEEVQDGVVRAAYSLAVQEPTETGSGEIQWMPPGESNIRASVNGKPGKLTVKATAETAKLIDAQIKAMLAGGEEPYLDFNHDDKEASAWPVSASWGGEDKETGGVRVQVNWSDEGRAAVRGKRFRRFSPEFNVDKEGNVTGVGLNMGGLVNRPAFTGIQKVSAKSESAGGAAEKDNNNPAAGANPPMKEILKVLAKLGLITSEELSESAAVGELSARGTEIKEGLQVRAKLSTDYVAKTEHDKVVTDLGAARKTNAELVVAKAVAEGKIAPKDDKVKAKFVDLITRDPANIELLESLPVTVAVPDRVVQATGAEREVNGQALATDGEFEKLVKAKASEKKISENEAIVVVASENPKAYETYRQSLLKKGGAQ